jgi:hypothetical protein
VLMSAIFTCAHKCLEVVRNTWQYVAGSCTAIFGSLLCPVEALQDHFKPMTANQLAACTVIQIAWLSFPSMALQPWRLSARALC